MEEITRGSIPSAKIGMYAVLLVAALVSGSALFGGLQAGSFSYGSADSEYQVKQINLPSSESYDCREEGFRCAEEQVEKDLKECHDPWQPWNALSSMNCEFKSNGTENLTLVSDSANYYTEDLYQKSYKTRNYSVNPGAWDLEFLPNGKAIWTTKNGGLYKGIDSEEKLASIDVVDKTENGLLGIAIDPDFERNGFLYAYYAESRSAEMSDEDHQRYNYKLSKFELENGELKERDVLLRNLGSVYHSGGRIEFGPDKKLYITAGDANRRYQTANLSFLGGKILRINRNGSIPKTNPFEESPVYSYGHRNPQGLAWKPETGNLYSTEHGPWRHDELNHIIKGEGYGWPYKKCGEVTQIPRESSPKRFAEDLKNNNDPVHCWQNYTMAPSGMTFVNDTDSRWHGQLFLTGLRGAHIAKVNVRNGSLLDYKIFYVSDNTRQVDLRLRDVEYNDGSLFVVGDSRGIAEIKPPRSSDIFPVEIT